MAKKMSERQSKKQAENLCKKMLLRNDKVLKKGIRFEKKRFKS